MVKKISFALGLLGLLKSVQSYSCDPSTCQPPSCTCASTLPPGGIDPKDAPQFVILSFDDAINDTTFDILKNMYKGIAHSNGCPVVATHFLQNIYTNYHQVQQLHAQGDEIALHTYYHDDSQIASQKEIQSGKTVISTFAGIPEAEIKGFRAPFLKFDNNLLDSLQNLGLTYDSSGPTVRQDSSWPYTLDNGFSDDIDCNTNGICGAIAPHNGLWEVPLYSTFYDNGNPPISMDQDYNNGNLLDVLKANFNYRYNGNRQPMAIAVHAIHCIEPEAKVQLYRDFIKWAISQKDVYFVTYSQLIEYMKNPVRASELSGHPAISCDKLNTYVVNSNAEICDGIDNTGDGNIDEGLVESCGVGNTYFSTCFGCPTSEPSVDNPNPSRNGNRITVPFQGCEGGTWDPLSSSCVSTSGSTYLEVIAPEKIVTEDNNNNPGVADGTTTTTYNGSSGKTSGALSSHLPTSLFTITIFSIFINYLLNHF